MYGLNEARDPSSAYSNNNIGLGLRHTPTNLIILGWTIWLRIDTCVRIYTIYHIYVYTVYIVCMYTHVYLCTNVHTSCLSSWLGVVLCISAARGENIFTAIFIFLYKPFNTSPNPPLPNTEAGLMKGVMSLWCHNYKSIPGLIHDDVISRHMVRGAKISNDNIRSLEKMKST